MMLVESFDFESERRSEILFVANHYIDERRELAINSHCFCLTTNRLPKRFAIVQIVRDQRAVFSRYLHRFTSDSRRRFGQRTEDAAGVKPTRSFRTKDLFPIDVAGL